MDRVIAKTEVFEEKKYDPTAGVWNSSMVSKVEKAYKYDEKGHVIKELDGVGFDDAAAGATVQEKINNGWGVEYKYNLAGI